jgi:hypothetical protein
MNDKKTIQNVAPDEKPKRAKPQHQYRASIGKIACCPHQIREELNLRLFNGQQGPEVLPWLNDLPPVKEILAARFKGAPVNDQNLSNWRRSGYRCWLAEQKKLSAMKNLGEYATGMAVAAGENISRGAAAVASGKLIEFLDHNDGEDATTEDVTKCAEAAVRLLKGEQNNVRLQISRERLRQHELHLRLKRDKQHRDSVAIALRILDDAQAKAIATSPISMAEKIEAIGLHMFGKFWEPRPIRAQESQPPISTKNL